MNTSTQPIIRLTSKAAQQVRHTLKGEKSSLIRVGAAKGGCSGYKYTMDPALPQDVLPTDILFQSEGLQIVVNSDCLHKILGSLEIDYQDGSLTEKGFLFKSLNDTNCGCGKSFAAVQS